jgi:hypothetical protein
MIGARRRRRKLLIFLEMAEGSFLVAPEILAED